MKKWMLMGLAVLAMLASSTAMAGRWSVGYTDYSRHGAFNFTIGSHGYRSASWYAPSWYATGGYGYQYGYYGSALRPSYGYVRHYAPARRYYDDCYYYGCGASVVYRGYSAPRYYGYVSPRYYASYPSRSYSYSYYSSPRYDRRDYRSDYRRDNRGTNYSYRDDRYRGNDRRDERAYDRVRSETVRYERRRGY